ncbi:hypothetical protein INT45_000611 [Circinella minor]|uniref:MATH domain-containing protein n=1 Tax=Circinella minor TaxID=1195481 RepID=A0A8H7SDD9_9FUNG|nr:hypothetical protein INT45_000611 [Circinella minor]
MNNNSITANTTSTLAFTNEPNHRYYRHRYNLLSDLIKGVDDSRIHFKLQLPPYRPVDFLTKPPNVLSVVQDYEEIGNELFDKVDEELIESKCIHWDIANFHSLSNKVEGPKFEVGGHTWNLLFFPKGIPAASSSSDQRESYAALYLQWREPSGTADNNGDDEPYACAQFAVSLSSPKYPTNYVMKAAQHRFTEEEEDWGFTRLVNHQHIHQGNKETNQDPLLQGGQIRATAIVRVFKDSTGGLWHNFLNYDSKKHLNIVGIRNEGATGYLTVLVQLLFFTSYFRKSIYETPSQENSILAALQSIFYQLQVSLKPIETTELTKSFGWEMYDLFIQQDVIAMKEVLQSVLVSAVRIKRENIYIN